MDDGDPFSTSWIHYPDGQSIYSSAYIKSIFAWMLSPLLSPANTYNLLLFLSRLLGPICCFFAMRAWGYKDLAATGFAVFVGMSPYLHGYSVEGIVEGVDVWPLALWLWACARQKTPYMIASFALCILMSWYLGAVVCLLAVILSRHDTRILFSLLGVLVAAPAIWTFVHAHPTMGAIPLDIRETMSAQWGIPTPNIMSKSNPFAKNNYIGWCAMIALFEWRYARWALIPLALSFGIGADLPLLSFVRFPYRWHLATMVLIGFAIARLLERKNWWWFPFLVLLEFLTLSRIDLFIPRAPAQIPEIYQYLDRPVLDIPGPLALPAGTANPSRERAQYLLYAQLYHHQPSLWAQDFNTLHPPESSFDNWQSWDPILKRDHTFPTRSDHEQLKKEGASVVIHHRRLKKKDGEKLVQELVKIGFSIQKTTKEHTLLFP